MSAGTKNETELLVSLSRRQLGVAVGLVVLLGASALAIIAFPESAAAAGAGKLFLLLPLIITIALLALRSSAKRAGLSTDPSSPAMKAVRGDELRQASQARAWRNGLMATMVLQPLLAVCLTWASAPSPVALMAAASVLTGVIVTLASLLYYDR
jgi:hypothetical protein